MRTPLERSPYGLIQEDLRDQPWKLLVACSMLNLTHIRQVRPVIWKFFEEFPDARAAAKGDVGRIAELLKPLGLQNRRAVNLIKLSTAFDSMWDSVTELPGVGKYAADSYRMFVEGYLDVVPTDSKLKAYLEWALGRKSDETRNEMCEDP